MEVKGKKVLVFGLGISGIGAGRFWKDRERKSYCMMEIRSLWKKK